MVGEGPQRSCLGQGVPPLFLRASSRLALGSLSVPCSAGCLATSTQGRRLRMSSRLWSAGLVALEDSVHGLGGRLLDQQAAFGFLEVQLEDATVALAEANAKFEFHEQTVRACADDQARLPHSRLGRVGVRHWRGSRTSVLEIWVLFGVERS